MARQLSELAEFGVRWAEKVDRLPDGRSVRECQVLVVERLAPQDATLCRGYLTEEIAASAEGLPEILPDLAPLTPLEYQVLKDLGLR